MFGLKLTLLILAAALIAPAQQVTATLKGQVTDNSGALIPGASVSIRSSGLNRTTTTDQVGAYTFAGLPAGQYTVRASATGFGPHESTVALEAAKTQTLDFGLVVTMDKQEVTVAAEGAPRVSTEASNNAGAIVLRGEDLDALPDDPDDLAADLQALAGPSAGPNGGQIYVDGFSNAQLPPKASIREIRINQNPFSAEYDRLGFGRIEILTKPGSDRFHGQAYFNDGDAVFNSRNPFSPNKPDFQSRQYGGNFGGPLGKKASFFFNAERREIDDNALINATIVDPATLAIEPFRQAVVTPQRRTEISPRLDYQLTPGNTLTVRYQYERSDQPKAGVGQFSLPSRTYGVQNTQHELRVTETAALSARTVNETRFQFERTMSGQNGDNSQPAINVTGAFSGGAPQVGLASTNTNHFELQNYTTMALGAHGLKFGMRVRVVTISDASPSNFGGTFTFAGGIFAPLLDASNQVVLDPSGNPELVQLNSIQQYQRTLALQQAGFTAAQIRQLGGGASQFAIAAGNPAADVRQVDIAPFVQDDWRVKPNLTLSLGLRYETQTNIHDWRDLAPRVGFAWAPGAGAKKKSKTVIRGGFGMFYDRISEDLTLSALRFNGVNQTQYVLTNPDFFPVVPLLSQFAAQAAPLTVDRLASNIRAPYVMQGAIGVERQLPWNTTIATTFTYSHADHLLLTRNINAPLPGTYNPADAASGVRPLGGDTNIYQYESSGVLKQNQWITNIRSQASRNSSLFAFYVLNYGRSNTDGVGSFPANQYDLSTEWGRSSIDVRHRFVLGGSIAAPKGFRLSPFIIAQSGAPFNITIGRDLNGDNQFTDRPAFATDPNKPGVVVTPWGIFDPNPTPGEQIIPRNYGQSPGAVFVNLRLSRTFGFGAPRNANSNFNVGGGGGGPRGGGPRGGGPGGMVMGGGGGMRGMFGDTTEKRYNLTFYASARNLLNHVNPGPIVGALTSPLFGQSTNIAGGFGPVSGAGNRRLELGLRFSF